MRRARLVAAVLSMAAIGCSDTGDNISGIPGYAIVEVRVDPSNATVFVPDTITIANRVQFAGTALGKNGTLLPAMTFAWSTSDATIATVDSTGMVTPVRPGTVEVRASADKIGKATLVIVPATEAVVVSPSRDTIFVDDPIAGVRDTTRLAASARDLAGNTLTGVAFAWQSSSSTVATVDAAGVVHAVGLGTSTVTVTANGHSATSTISVMPVVASVVVTSPATQVLALDTLQLTAVAKSYTNANMPRAFTWTSSNTSVATVDSTGKVNFVAAGQATFTARTAFRTAAVTVTASERKLLAMEAGDEFTCGYTALGRGYCWGLSRNGRTGAPADSVCQFTANPANQDPCILPPKRMNKPEVAFTAVSAGGDFGCGISTDRTLYCWGNNAQGQLGNGFRGSGEVPVPATVKSERFTAISAGASHACALNMIGVAYCWGSDSNGQLGDNRLINSTTPIPVADTTLLFRAISAGDRHTCGITVAGLAYCWGENSLGQLGNGTQLDAQTPSLVAGSLTFIAISAGKSHTCGVDSAGNMYCWGDNTTAQLGLGTQLGPQLVPALVTGGGGYTAVSAGAGHTCGIAGGAVKCWGLSDWGQVGDGNDGSHTVLSPITVAGIQASSISVGTSHSCAMSTAGVAMCWGSNRWGALGNELQASVRATPQLVARPR